MKQIAADGKPCGAGRPRIEPPKATKSAVTTERLMSSIAAIAIIVFLVAIAALNKIEFGRFD